MEGEGRGVLGDIRTTPDRRGRGGGLKITILAGRPLWMPPYVEGRSQVPSRGGKLKQIDMYNKMDEKAGNVPKYVNTWNHKLKFQGFLNIALFINNFFV